MFKGWNYWEWMYTAAFAAVIFLLLYYVGGMK